MALKSVFGLRARAQTDLRADAISELEMSGKKVGVEVAEEDVADLKVVFSGTVQVLVDVALRIEDHSLTGLFVTDEVGGVRETAKVILFEDHKAVVRES